MIKKNIETAGDFIIVREQGMSRKDTLLEGVITQDYIGFTFYEEGNSIVLNVHGNKIGEKRSMRWSTFFVSATYGNIFKEIPRNTNLSQLTILFPFNYIKNRFTEKTLIDSPFHNLINPSEIYVDLNQKIAPLEIFQPALKVLNCSILTSERTLFLESQCLELLSQIIYQLRSEANNHIKLSLKDLERLNYAKELLVSDLQSTPSLKKMCEITGLNIYTLKEGFKIVFGAPPFKWLQEFKLSLAHSKLQSKEYTVSEVAYFVGYSSVNSFNNIFHKRYGYRPGKLTQTSQNYLPTNH